MNATTTRYPLLFNCREQIVGRGFLVGIAIEQGRVLALHDEAACEDCEKWWIDGVSPGAITECGGNLRDAMDAFVATLRNVLIDYASSAPSFDDFKADVTRFFEDCDKETRQEWDAARAEVVAGRLSYGELPRVIASEPRLIIESLAIDPASNRDREDCVPSSLAA